MMRLYTKPGCPDCVAAEEALTKAGFEFTEVVCDKPHRVEAAARITGAQVFPVLEQNGLIFSGDDVLIAIEEGELE